MRWIKLFVSSLTGIALVALAAAGGGCSALFAGTNDIPHVNGTWTGELTEIAVRDANGNQYKAAALRIIEGPDVSKLGGFPEDKGGGRLPLLVRTWDRPLLVLEAQGQPTGRRVQVSGRMQGSFVGVEAADGLTPFVQRRKPYVAGEGEHLLILRGAIKVLDK